VSPLLERVSNSAFGFLGSTGPAGAFESIASATGTGSSANILFSNIPSTYQHLQIRILGRSDDTSSNTARYFFVQCNSDFPTTNVYSWHGLYGDGASVVAEAAPILPTGSMQLRGASQSTSTNTMGVAIIDIHDYASTTRNKTIRSFSGVDFNGSGSVALYSGLYQSTSAINAVRVSINTGNFSTNTRVALYGIKGA
jgi:hypothetical protein